MNKRHLIDFGTEVGPNVCLDLTFIIVNLNSYNYKIADKVIL